MPERHIPSPVEAVPPEVDEQLVRDLRERGGDDPTVQERLRTWVQQQEAWAEERGIAARIVVERRRALLYWRSGHHAHAEEAWEAALTMAHEEGDIDLMRSITEEMRAQKHDAK